MKEKAYFTIFILCAILPHGILSKFIEEDVGEASKLLVRQKRVIDRSPGGETPLRNGEASYVVNLKKYNRFHCTATILSRYTVITATGCIRYYDIRTYSVDSGSVYSHRGNAHNVTDRKLHGHNPSGASTFQTGIALLTVDPPFVFNKNTGSIGLHSGLVLAGMEGTVAGWGTHVNSGPVETAHPKRLRYISVPIMNHRECQNIYRGHFPITEEEICTYHSEKLCGDTDGGAPLVIEDQLVGVNIGGVPTRGTECPIKPDVFVLVQHSNYAPWILSNIKH